MNESPGIERNYVDPPGDPLYFQTPNETEIDDIIDAWSYERDIRVGDSFKYWLWRMLGWSLSTKNATTALTTMLNYEQQQVNDTEESATSATTAGKDEGEYYLPQRSDSG